MKVLLTGVTGQVGAALRGFEVIVNPAAFTSVDEAERQPGTAHAVNAEGPGVLALEAKRLGALLVHYSTDYVFDGALRRPYVATDPPNPLSTYGRTKLDGEARTRASGCRHAILRPAGSTAAGAASRR